MGIWASGLRSAHVWAALLNAMLLGGCDNTFEPTSPGGLPFSIFGYLDATADTQWIRVSGLRSMLLATSAPTGARVTLEDVATGRIIELRDSALSYVSMLAPVWAHEFWAPVRVRPDATYRFRAVAQDGSTAESLVKLPPLFKVEPWILTMAGGLTTWVRLEGMSHLAFAIWNVDYYDGCNRPGQLRMIDHAAHLSGDSAVRMYYVRPEDAWFMQGVPMCGTRSNRVTRREVQIVSSAVPWPTGQDLSTWRLAPESNSSNVAGAVGFLGGVVKRSTRVEDCILPFRPGENYCKLHYDSTTATLQGQISSECPLNLDSVEIQLRELDPPAPELPRTRRGISDLDFHFDIGALRPGIRHELSIKYRPIFFRPITDTLTFVAGRTTQHAVLLHPWSTCPR